MIRKPGLARPDGMTLIELLIVVAVMGILLAIVVPNYRSHMLRVHRSEAIRMLLLASMCQQRVFAVDGKYDTNRCLPSTGYQAYQLSYDPAASRGGTYRVLASPKASQQADPCGRLSLDQNGTRGVSATGVDAIKCWNGR